MDEKEFFEEKTDTSQKTPEKENEVASSIEEKSTPPIKEKGLAEKAERMEKFIQNFYAQLMADCKNPEEIIKIKAYLEYRKQLYVVLNNGGPKEDVAKIHEEFYDTLAKPFQATKPGLYNIEGEGRLIYVMYNELHNFMFSILSSEY